MYKTLELFKKDHITKLVHLLLGDFSAATNVGHKLLREDTSMSV
jgi:hypothetical protein